jgi:methylmalonyl-CoA/ethylmalonyl-CoA epimerase
MKAKKIDHICIAVHDLETAKKRYEETLGLELSVQYEAESEKIRVARYYLGEVALELMEPTGPDSEVAKFLEKRGEGVFLISYLVADVEKGLKELHDKGERTIDTVPRVLLGNRYAFIQPPKRLGGVLTEIIEGEFDKKKAKGKGQ